LRVIHTPDTKLGTVCQALDIRLDAHNAMNDITATLEVERRIGRMIRGDAG